MFACERSFPSLPSPGALVHFLHITAMDCKSGDQDETWQVYDVAAHTCAYMKDLVDVHNIQYTQNGDILVKTLLHSTTSGPQGTFLRIRLKVQS